MANHLNIIIVERIGTLKTLTIKDFKLEEIYKKLLMVYDFNPKDENLIIVRGEQKIYIPERKFYVPLPPDGVFVYDKSKLKVYCRCN